MMTEKIMAKGLARLFKNNVQKLHRLPENMILDREFQFGVELIKKLNKMLEIQIKLSTAFHLQTNGQIERKNQKSEQYSRMYINYRQNNWFEQLVTTELTFNKIYSNKVITI